MMTALYPLRADGLIHASRVIALVRSSALASAIVTQLLVPLKEAAPPNLPCVDQPVFESVPTLPLPDPSLAVVPLPSLNPYAATRPGVVAGGVHVVEMPLTGAAMSA